MSDFARLLRSQSFDASKPLDDVFSEEPVPLDIFIEDKKFLYNPPLSPTQYEAVRYIERIYYQDLYPLMSEAFDPKKSDVTTIGPAGAFTTGQPYWGDDIRMANYICLQWGKGSGKDHVCRVAALRISYMLLCLRSPQMYYGLPPQDTIHLLNVASSSQQAQQAFFTPITKAVTRGWFADKCHPKPGVGIISWQKNVEAISGHADAESQEGLNLMLGVADEIDAFKSKDEFSNRVRQLREPTKSAEGILKMIETSAASRFPETFKNVRISYPRYMGSMIQKLTKEAREDIEENGKESKYYVSGPLATWDVNPRYDKYERISVQGTDAKIPKVITFINAYKKDAITAKSMYECRPSNAVNPYFRNEMAIEACMVEMERQPIEVTYRRVKSDEAVDGYVWEPIYDFAPDFRAIKGAQYVIHGDLAVTGDYAGISMAHVVSQDNFEDFAETEDGSKVPVIEVRTRVKVDFAFPFTSDVASDPPREIQIRWARQLAMELRKRGFNIKLMTFDGFNSLDSMQQLKAKGIDSKKVSTDLSEDPWKNLRDLMYEGRITMPMIPLLKDELFRLTKLPNGKVDHPANGSKDLADAVACAALGAVNMGGRESADGETSYFEPATFEVGSTIEGPIGFGVDMLDMPLGLPSNDTYRYPF